MPVIIVVLIALSELVYITYSGNGYFYKTAIHFTFIPQLNFIYIFIIYLIP